MALLELRQPTEPCNRATGYRLRDLDLAKTLGLTTKRWHYCKQVLLARQYALSPKDPFWQKTESAKPNWHEAALTGTGPTLCTESAGGGRVDRDSGTDDYM